MSLENTQIIINERLEAFLGKQLFNELKAQKNMYNQIFIDLSYCRNHVLDKTNKDKEKLFKIFQEQMVNFFGEIFFNKTSKLTKANFEKNIVQPFKKYGNILNVDISAFSEEDRAENLEYKLKLLETYFLFKNKYELIINAHYSNNITRTH